MGMAEGSDISRHDDIYVIAFLHRFRWNCRRIESILLFPELQELQRAEDTNRWGNNVVCLLRARTELN